MHIRRLQLFTTPILALVGVLVIPVLLTSLSACGSKDSAPQGPPTFAVVGYEIKVTSVRDDLNLVGSLEAFEEVLLKSEIDGQVEEIASHEGDAVSEGELLFKIDADKLKAEVEEAEANFTLAKVNKSRSEELLKKKTISVQEHDQSEATFTSAKAALTRARNRLEDSEIVAPFSGMLGERLVSVGAYVQAGDPLSNLVSIEPLKVSFEVPEKYFSQIKVGQIFNLHVATYKDETFQGEVYFVAPQVDRERRTFLVKGKTENKDRKLRPGMFANIALTLSTNEQAITVPDSSIMMEKDKVFVYAITKDNIADMREIKISRIIKASALVESGLQAGDRIVAQGYQKLFPGAQVQATRWLNSDNTQNVEEQN